MSAIHPSSGPLLSIMDCEGITADRMEVFEGVSPLVYADGLNTKNIFLTHTNTVEVESSGSLRRTYIS